MTQRYFGQTNEPNDVEYIGKIIGNTEAEKLKSLNAGEFLYWHKGKVSKISVEPYESDVVKKQIVSTTTPKAEPLPKITTPQNNYALIEFVAISLLALIILILGR